MQNYPRKLGALRRGDDNFIAFLKAHLHEWDKPTVAEIGVYEGATSVRIAELLGSNGTLHLFDFKDRADAIANRCSSHCSVVSFGNDYHYLDSYCWPLGQLLPGPRLYDCVFLDGAHTWAIDALAFLLVTRLIKPGGYIWFDDLDWNLAGSTNFRDHEDTAKMYTPEQRQTFQVQMIVDKLVIPDPQWKRVGENVWQLRCVSSEL